MAFGGYGSRDMAFIGFDFRVHMTRSILTRRGLGNRHQALRFPLIYLFVFCILRHFHCAHRLVPPNSIHRHSFIPRGMTVGILPRGQHPLSQLNNWVSPLCVNKNRNRKCERMLSLCVTMMIVIFPCHTNVCQQMTEGL